MPALALLELDAMGPRDTQPAVHPNRFMWRSAGSAQSEVRDGAA